MYVRIPTVPQGSANVLTSRHLTILALLKFGRHQTVRGRLDFLVPSGYSPALAYAPPAAPSRLLLPLPCRTSRTAPCPDGRSGPTPAPRTSRRTARAPGARHRTGPCGVPGPAARGTG